MTVMCHGKILLWEESLEETEQPMEGERYLTKKRVPGINGMRSLIGETVGREWCFREREREKPFSLFTLIVKFPNLNY